MVEPIKEGSKRANDVCVKYHFVGKNLSCTFGMYLEQRSIDAMVGYNNIYLLSGHIKNAFFANPGIPFPARPGRIEPCRRRNAALKLLRSGACRVACK